MFVLLIWFSTPFLGAAVSRGRRRCPGAQKTIAQYQAALQPVLDSVFRKMTAQLDGLKVGRRD